jgi:hypothetical protein
VHWEIRETMTELDVELVIAKALEKHPGLTPRIISDNGPQFIAEKCLITHTLRMSQASTRQLRHSNFQYFASTRIFPKVQHLSFTRALRKMQKKLQGIAI